MRIRSSFLPSFVAGSAAVFACACGVSDEGPTGLSVTGGSVDVSVAATGIDVPAAFRVALDAGVPRSIDANGSTSFASVSAGEHTVTLSDVPPNCAVEDANPRPVSVANGAVVELAFSVTCRRSAGAVAVTAPTSGTMPDPDGYTVTLDGSDPRPLAPAESVTFSAVPTGTHALEILDVSPNCAVRGDNPASATVLAGEQIDVQFRIECFADAGALRLTTVTTGDGEDADGFIALVDEDEPYAVVGDGVRTIGGLVAGEHEVELLDVAEQCAVTGDNPANFSITPDAATDLTMTIECTSGGALPIVTISSPDTTRSLVPLTVPPGTQVTFAGRAIDAAGREIEERELSWTSNLDGELGRGGTIVTSTLSEGQHTVRLSVEADAGTGSGAGSATVLVVVVSPTQPGYQIKLRLEEGLTLTPVQSAVIEDAIDKLTTVVVGDIPDVPFETSSFACGATVPPLDEVIDDLILYLSIEDIDGPGGILGAATPCIEREGSELPALGGMVFDAADLAALEEAGLVDELLLHEAMHVMGFGSIWRRLGFLEEPSDPRSGGVPGADAHFDGPEAISRFLEIGGDAYTGGNVVPVENDTLRFGSGSLDGHWRESVLGHEIMTPALNTAAPANPLSVVTAGQFADLGYTVDFGAVDPYEQDFAVRAPGAGPGRTFVLEGDILPGPLWVVRPDGGKRRVR